MNKLKELNKTEEFIIAVVDFIAKIGKTKIRGLIWNYDLELCNERAKIFLEFFQEYNQRIKKSAIL